MLQNLSRKRAREGYLDVDYIDRLDPAAREWLEVFLRATVGLEPDAIAVLAGPDDLLHSELRREIYAEDRSQRRDVMYNGEQVCLSHAVGGRLVTDRHGRTITTGRCPHCCRGKCRCTGKRQRFPRYSPLDYQNR